jgi:hypothetical protein
MANKLILIHLHVHVCTIHTYIHTVYIHVHIVIYLKVTIFAGIDIFTDWSKNENFVPTNISYIHYRILEYVDPVPFPSTKFSTRKTRFKPKLQKKF